MSDATMIDRLSDHVFSEALRAIMEGRSQARRGVCLAFHASLADVMNSKSTRRLELFWKAVSGTELASKIRRAVYIFSGGCKYVHDAKGMSRIYAQEQSLLSFDSKLGWLYRNDVTQEQYAAALTLYNGIKTFDYDAVTVKTAPATLSLEPLLKSMRTMRDNRVDLSREQRERFTKLWDAACDIFPELAGMQLTRPTAATVAAPVAIDGETEAEMPAKPTRRRAANNAK